MFVVGWFCRTAKRKLALATHPDKTGNLPGVNEAFNLVTEVSPRSAFHLATEVGPCKGAPLFFLCGAAPLLSVCLLHLNT